MTISAQNTAISYTGNGVTTVFAYNFRILDATYIKVYLNGVLQVGGYSVSGVDVAGGGNITFLVAPANGVAVLFQRITAKTQDVDYVPYDPFPSETHERALDKLTMLVQESSAGADHSIKIPPNEDVTVVNTQLPGAAGRALQFVGFDASGNVIVGQPVGSPATPYMQTVLAAVNDVAARATLVAAKSIITTKGDLYVGGAVGVEARHAVGTDGRVLVADSTQADGLVWADLPARPNLLVNPNWLIDQNAGGGLYTVSGAVVQGPDGWSGTATGAGVFKLRTLVDPDNAALNCLEITCTTADAAIAATDQYRIFTAVEGYDAAALQAGTANAQSITIQFKFKSNVNGVYGIAIQNSATNRRYIGTIVVADALEHEYTVTLTMDTAGTWLYTNGVGLFMYLTLAAGANFQNVAGAWAAGAETTTNAQCNFMSVNTNIAYLKRVQLLPGSQPQAYRAANYQQEIAKAQRYWWIATGYDAVTYGSGGGTVSFAYTHPVKMRVSPTTTVTVGPSLSNSSGFNAGSNGTMFTLGVAVSGTGQLSWSGAQITFNARLA